MVKAKKVTAIIQARMNSERLPGKVMMNYLGKTMLRWVVERVKAAHSVDEIWIATTNSTTDDIIEEEAINCKVKVLRGSETNVFERFYHIAAKSNPDIIIRVTADNPFIYYQFINNAVISLSTKGYDYVSYKSIPLGTGVEVFTSEALTRVNTNITSDYDKEHVTTFIKIRPDIFLIKQLKPHIALQRSDIRLTVDTIEDKMLATAIFYFMEKQTFELAKIIELFDEQPWLLFINKNVKQKE